MDEWMDEWMDGWMDGGRKEGRKDGRNECVEKNVTDTVRDRVTFCLLSENRFDKFFRVNKCRVFTYSSKLVLGFWKGIVFSFMF